MGKWFFLPQRLSVAEHRFIVKIVLTGLALLAKTKLDLVSLPLSVMPRKEIAWAIWELFALQDPSDWLLFRLLFSAAT